MEPVPVFIKIFFGCFLGIGGGVLILLAFLIGWKYLFMEKRCTAHTVGIVKKYGAGGNPNASTPVVFYMVNGREYKCKGPLEKIYTNVSKTTPHSKNSARIDGNRMKIETNSFVQLIRDPTRSRYPKGTRLNVYYNPDNPKLAYVEKYCNRKYFFWLMFLFGVATWIFVAVLLFIL